MPRAKKEEPVEETVVEKKMLPTKAPVGKLDLKFGVEDLNKLVEKVNEIIEHVN